MQIQPLRSTGRETSPNTDVNAVGRAAPVSPAKEANGATTISVKETTGAPSAKHLEAAVDEANKTMKAIESSLQFAVDPTTNTTVIKVIDTTNNSVIRQIPAQQMLDIAQALDRMKGVFLKQEA